jgi:hypothetical protein
MEEQTADLARDLTRQYGSCVSVEYVDVFSKRMEEFPSVLRVVDRGAPLPIIAFDGKARFAGGISTEMIAEVLQTMGLVPLDGSPEG